MRDVVGFVVIGGFVCFAACVGNDPDTAGPQPDPNVPAGQYKGACTADGKCLEGLECNQGVCLYKDGGGPSSSSGNGSSSGGGSSSGSSGSDSGADTGVVSCPFSASMDAKIKCGSENCSTPGRCCFLPGIGSSCDPTTCEQTIGAFGGKNVGCDSAQDCLPDGGPLVCCFRTAKEINTAVCPSVVPFQDFKESQCAASCAGANELKTCSSNADCSGGECRRVQLADIGLELGVCL